MEELVKTFLNLTNKDNVVIVHKPLVLFTGSLEAGMMLAQLLYWTPRARLPGGWIAKSDSEWQDELMLSRYSVREARRKLVELGIIKTKLGQFAGAPTTHYLVDMDALEAAWSVWIQTNDCTESDERMSDNGQSITETTTDITSEQKTPTACDERTGDKPRNFDEWYDLVRRSNNKQAIIARMVGELFPDRDAPHPGYVAKTAKNSRIRGYGRLVQLVWQASSYRPTGDVLSYCIGLARGHPTGKSGSGTDKVEQEDGQDIWKIKV
jgi:hypothetical protein